MAKIRRITPNNRRRAFEVATSSRSFLYPYVNCDPRPEPSDPVERVYADPELAREAFTYELASGAEGTIHMDHVLEYNRDPEYLKNHTLYNLTLAAQERMDASELSTREIIRRLGTSASQFYRLLDQTNYRKSIGQLLALLDILDCEVEFVVRERTPGSSRPDRY